MNRYATIVGLEIHVRLKTATKMFCRCPSVPETAAPNSSICPVCTGQPGALPVLNEQAVRLGVRIGLALNGTIRDKASFDRKSYFYPDLPKGYQISQFDQPIVEGGALAVPTPLTKDGVRTIGITRAHLEEDAAKNIHDPASGATLVDFNRAGAPLLEIVTDPDIRSPQEAKAFLQELQALLRAIHASDADMEKGYMRCDANISLLPIDEEGHALQKEFNPKVEIKNMNSFRAVEHALQYEIRRQSEIYNAGGTASHETRGWDDPRGETVSQRSKESSADYRFFPEPDLPDIVLTRIREEERAHLPELPAEKRARLVTEFAFAPEDASLIVERGWSDFAENVMGELGTWMEARDASGASAETLMERSKPDLAKLLSNWLLNKLAAILNEKNLGIKDARIDAENMAEFLQIVSEGAINSTNAQKLLQIMVETGADPSHIMEEQGLGQMNDEAGVIAMIDSVIQANPNQAEQVRGGKEPVLKWLVGQVMRTSEGRIDPKKAEELLRKQLLG
ncbi:Asp-tRNA(Asn)/Glu-tRNA(Gln) amidotransferase subunit GatB [Patescibacteria group bacterium]|nr:Asp-tRNA(Asn)/Glu-tRNA(Gln) amidotransferase subunit GatB [Patescibacteria group bacterium]